MSGGIDSSYCVSLLQKQGYEVLGVYLNNLPANQEKNNWSNVKKIADYLKVKILKVKANQRFNKNVIKPFLKDYQNGLTPNPCILCNRVFKFKELFDLADKLGIEKVATGHYVKLKKDGQLVYLSPAKDSKKDQSYFLYQLPQAFLKRLVFPLGNLEKPQVKLAAAKVLTVELLPSGESQEICFVPEDNLSKFLQQNLSKRLGGQIIDQKTGKALGQYPAEQYFTIGQRKGLGLAGGPWFVSKIDEKNSKVYVLNDKDKKDLLKSEIHFKKIIWSGKIPKLPLKIKYKLRSAQNWTNGVLSKKGQVFVLRLAKDQLAPSPGQSAVFLSGGKVIGGQVVG